MEKCGRKKANRDNTQTTAHSFYRQNKSKSDFNIRSVEWNKPTNWNEIVNFNLLLFIFHVEFNYSTHNGKKSERYAEFTFW